MTKKGDKPRAFKKAGKNKGGRPLKLTEQIIKKICEQIEYGNYTETAIAIAGVPKPTFYLWLKLGHEKPRSIYKKLLDAVEFSKAKSESDDVMRMKLHSRNNHKATAWRLERRFPERWSVTHRAPIQSASSENETGFVLSYSLDDDEPETTKGETEK